MLTENNRRYLTINYNLFIVYSRIRTVTTPFLQDDWNIVFNAKLY